MNQTQTTVVELIAVMALTAIMPGCDDAVRSVKQPPVVVTVRESLVNKGKVLKITNTSSEYLHQVEVQVGGAASSALPAKSAVVAVALAPHATASVGWLELGDRPLVVGDVVAIRCHEYGQPLMVTVPEVSSANEAVH